MEGNDIGVTYVARYAVRFEGLLMHEKLEPEGEKPPSRWKRKREKAPTSVARESKKWRVNDMPMKSLLDFTTRMHQQVTVVTYMGEWFEEEIESWLARKGAQVEVISYEDAWEWAEDLRRNPEIKGYYTHDAEERDVLGWQHVTLVRPSQTWGT
jgi:hypothetical protein